MALISKSGKPSLASPNPSGGQVIVGLKAASGGIEAGALCILGLGSDVDAQAGEAVTLYRDVAFHYGSGLTPGAPYYVAATAGRLDTAPTTGGTVVVARALDATRIQFTGQA